MIVNNPPTSDGSWTEVDRRFIKTGASVPRPVAAHRGTDSDQREELQRYCGPTIDAFDCRATGSCAIDGEPGSMIAIGHRRPMNAPGNGRAVGSRADWPAVPAYGSLWKRSYGRSGRPSIAGWLKRTYPDNESLHVSHETIYRSLFIQARGALKKELTAYLRSKRTIRRSAKASRKGMERGRSKT